MCTQYSFVTWYSPTNPIKQILAGIPVEIPAVSPLMPSLTGLGHALVRSGGFHYIYRRARHAKAFMVG